MATRPAIGISAALEPARWGPWEQEALLVPRQYADAVQRAGGIALLLAPDDRLVADPAELLERLDGVLLTGGADVDPATYGEPAHPQTGPLRPARDAFEIALVRGALERDLPILGICRGSQILNVACGGTLRQHLPEELGSERHRPALGSFAGAAHALRVTPGSLAARVAGDPPRLALSHHHQGLGRIGAGLTVTAWAVDDDLPEAIEARDRRFALGVQWHPEADDASTVIAALVEAASGLV